VRSLAAFSIDDVSAVSDVIRGLGRDAVAMETAAGEITRYLYDELRDEDGGRACALVRLYKTHPFGGLPPDLREYAETAAGHALAPEVRCLTLLGTNGDLPEWNDRTRSSGHKAIPLADEQVVLRLPMIAQLIIQLGLDVGSVIRPQEAPLRELSQRTYDVFYVERAAGSPFIPAQGFVEEHGIASALGFGGMLHTGDFYAAVLFSKVPVSESVARSLKIVALAVRIPLMRFLLGSVFERR
jgi:hypothetical protein